MTIQKLKIINSKPWAAASSWTTPQGQTMQLPASQKLVAIDEDGDIVNLNIITDVPLTYKNGDIIPAVHLLNSTNNQYGWTCKAEIKSLK